MLVTVPRQTIAGPIGLNLEDEVLTSFWNEEMVEHNVCGCDDDAMSIRFGDGSNVTYSFAHNRTGKAMQTAVDDLWSRGLVADRQGFDFIVFNLGNPPFYGEDVGGWENALGPDLEYLKHTEKPIIHIATWQQYSLHKIEKMRRRFPNLLVVSEKRRGVPVGEADELPLISHHMCMPGPVAHHALSMLHLINLLGTISNAGECPPFWQM